MSRNCSAGSGTPKTVMRERERERERERGKEKTMKSDDKSLNENFYSIIV